MLVTAWLHSRLVTSVNPGQQVYAQVSGEAGRSASGQPGLVPRAWNATDVLEWSGEAGWPMKRRKIPTGLAGAALAAGSGGGAASRAGRHSRYGKPVALPAPAADGSMSLEQVIERRRSQRVFRPDPLSVTTIGQLLWAGQGVTSADGKRTAPSAGASYPLELYLVTHTEVLHYLPEGHQVESRAATGLRSALQAAALGQEPVGAAPAVLVVAAVPGRTQPGYGTRAAAFVQLEAGHAAQNILLEATARGLAAVPIGSFDPARAAAVLALPTGQEVLYLIPVGLTR